MAIVRGIAVMFDAGPHVCGAIEIAMEEDESLLAARILAGCDQPARPGLAGQGRAVRDAHLAHVAGARRSELTVTEDAQAWIERNAARLRDVLADSQVRADVLTLLGGCDAKRKRERRLEEVRRELAGLELRWRMDDEP